MGSALSENLNGGYGYACWIKLVKKFEQQYIDEVATPIGFWIIQLHRVCRSMKLFGNELIDPHALNRGNLRKSEFGDAGNARNHAFRVGMPRREVNLYRLMGATIMLDRYL
jgi:hypothetical protein